MNRDTLENALKIQQPEGWVSSMSSAGLVRPGKRPAGLPGEGRVAAVMLILFGDEPNLVMTRRPETLKHHPGQISFPGGRVEDGETLEQAALREVEEEIGVPGQQVEVLGSLQPHYVPPSDFTVTPFVGWMNQQPEFVLQQEEVAELITVRLSHFMDTSVRKFSDVDNDPVERAVPWFALRDLQIWGASAMFLDDLIQRIERCHD